MKEVALSWEGSLVIYTIFQLKRHDGIYFQLDIFKLSNLCNSQNFKFQNMTFDKLGVNWIKFVSE